MTQPKRQLPEANEMNIIPDEQDGTVPFVQKHKIGEVSHAEVSFAEATHDDPEGQLAVDVFQNEKEIVIIAPIAGIKKDDVSISVTDDVLTIRGTRAFHFTVSPDEYVTRECYWGTFSRTIILPETADRTKVAASFKNAILTIRIPKHDPVKMKRVEIE